MANCLDDGEVDKVMRLLPSEIRELSDLCEPDRTFPFSIELDMRKHIRIWVMVMDAGRVQLFDLDEKSRSLHPRSLPGLPAEGPHAYARDLKSDRPGRSFGSAHSGTRHAIEPRHDHHKQEKHEAAAQVASALERSFIAHEYDRLVLVAPPRAVGEMRILLSARLQSQMDTIAKDLSKATSAEIWNEVAALSPWQKQAS
jgi:protein required for attachment to host cells